MNIFIICKITLDLIPIKQPDMLSNLGCKTDFFNPKSIPHMNTFTLELCINSKPTSRNVLTPKFNQIYKEKQFNGLRCTTCYEFKDESNYLGCK